MTYVYDGTSWSVDNTIVAGPLKIDSVNSRVGVNTNAPTVALDVVGDLKASGATTLSSTLNVTGATTLSSTLNVTGNLTVGGNILGTCNSLTYTPSGVGAVARSAASKMGDVVSVKDFGVVGDGTDETTKLQAAFDAVVSGVRLSLSGLTVVVNDPVSITNKSNFVIDGEGGTIIAKNGMSVSSGKNLIRLTNCEAFKIENITFDANRANRTPVETSAQTVYVISCRKFVFENVHSHNAVVDGFYFATATNTNPATYCLDFQLINCFANNGYRQGASVINAYDFQFIGGAYTNTNGTAPEAGIDVESNSGATLGNARGIFQGVRFENNNGAGLLLSDVSGAKSFVVDGCYFSANGKGGVLNYADSVHIRHCFFSNHSAAPGGAVGGIVTFANAASINGGSAVANIFTGNTTTIPCLYCGGGPQSVAIQSNVVRDHVNGGAISMFGSNHLIDNNTILACGGIGISINSATDCVISNNKVNAAVGRGIYDSSTRSKIISNKVSNISSVSGGYIQAAGTDSLLFGNVCLSATSVSDTGIRVDNTALTVNGNACVNLNSTDPYVFVGSALDDIAYNNVGGTDNDRRKVRFGLAVPVYSTGARPAASSVAAGQVIFNSTTQKLNTSDGTTNWYNADGTIA
jgi:parallel beta-helix repeat protein